MADRKDVVQGTLDLLVLRIIATQPMHGWGVMQRLRYLTDDIFQVTVATLANPVLGLAKTVQLIAKKAKAEKATRDARSAGGSG